MGAVTDTVNIRRIDPYKSTSASVHGRDAVYDSPKEGEPMFNLFPCATDGAQWNILRGFKKHAKFQMVN